MNFGRFAAGRPRVRLPMIVIVLLSTIATAGCYHGCGYPISCERHNRVACVQCVSGCGPTQVGCIGTGHGFDLIPDEQRSDLVARAQKWLAETLPALPDFERANEKHLLVVVPAESDVSETDLEIARLLSVQILV